MRSGIEPAACRSSITFSFFPLELSRRQSDIYSVTEDLVDRDNGRRCGDGGDAEFGLEKTCMSSAEFDSHLAGHRNGKAFLNGLLIAFGPFMMGMPKKNLLKFKMDS